MFYILPKPNLNFSFTLFLSFANAFNLDKFKILSFGENLTFDHTILTFNDPKKEAFLKTLWEKEKMLITSIFSTMFSTIPEPNLNFSFTSILSSANAFNMDRSKILSVSKEFTLFKTTDFKLFKLKVCRRQL